MTVYATDDQAPDVYGQLHPIETPKLIETKLAEFDDLVAERTQKIDDKNKELIQALKKCPDLLTKQFKLMFLRCEVFNTPLAVARYARYWRERVAVFGDEKAFQPLTLDKALSEDHAAIELGFVVPLPGVKDPKGRAIIFVNSYMLGKAEYTYMSLCRAVWYAAHVALESETAQKHGIIMLHDPSRASFSQFDLRFARQILPGMQGAVPLRLAALHNCKPPSFLPIVYAMVKIFLSERIKNRILFHSGKTSKVLKALALYGLDETMIPCELGGNVVVDSKAWFSEQLRCGR